MKHLSSRDNPTVKRLHALATSGRERRKQQQTMLDGPHLVRAALDAGWTLKELVVSEQGRRRAEIADLLERAGVAPVELTDTLFAHVSPVDAPSGLLGVVDLPPAPAPRAFVGSVVVLDGVQDTGNLGSILRTAAAAGIEDVLLTPGCAQAWSPRSLRAGMGAQLALRIYEHVDPSQLLLAYRGPILATGLGVAARPLYELDLAGPVAWLFGAEGLGVSPTVAALATTTVTIPMSGAVESLNVGAAAAVCLFEQLRQRGARRRDAGVLGARS